MKSVLIANRGEIALRIARACRAEGLKSVAVYSDSDQNSPHVWAADEAVRIGPSPPKQSYLRPELLLHVALKRGCDAIHPGYGFLSERADFAKQCRDEGLTFIGPSPEVIATMGDKAEARRAAMRLGVPVVPGSTDAFTDSGEAGKTAATMGYPILLKARAGGGGRGMRIVRDAQSFEKLFGQACGEAEAAFGDGAVYLERFVERVRHIEVQVFGDGHGNVRHVWERDCTVQRRHQKLIEEGPSPVLDGKSRAAICAAAEKLAAGVGYLGAGTVEFIFDSERREFYFIEMNTRIQVEHPVTEMLTGLDLVREQLRVAGGAALSFAGATPPTRGHAIEFRINAEDPDKNFRPSPGVVRSWRPPTLPDIRLDSHVYEGYAIPPYYDSLLGKLIVHGRDRADAIARAQSALDGFQATGVATTIPFHRRTLGHKDFIENRVHTRWVESDLQTS
jgi:acetyl-CoA carboxylase biotin carboxylase subunit